MQNLSPRRVRPYARLHQHECVFHFCELSGTIKSYQNYSAGLGYRFGHAYSGSHLYVYTEYKYLGDDIFYYNEAGMQFPIQSGTIDYQQNRHTVTLTMGVRF
ncbi:MAG: hypothetical protein ACLR8Y_12545 [Alistipes indistinctus]